MLVYAVKLVKEADGFVVSFSDIPEAVTQGESYEDALQQAKDALLTAFMIYEDERRAFPLPTEVSKLDVVRLSITESMKVFLHNAMLEAGWRKVDLAHSMSWSNSQVERALDPRYPTKIVAIEDALAKLNKHVIGHLVTS